MGKTVRIRKGYDIKLKGKAPLQYKNHAQAETFAIKPTDFHGLVPKLHVQVGTEVKAGTTLIHDKYKEEVLFTSPVSGEVIEINRGAKRKLLEVKILADKEIKHENFGAADANSLSEEQVKEKLLKSGCWPFIRQRPFDVIANPKDKPSSIFISAFDSNPLAADMNFVVQGKEKEFQAGLDALKKLTDGTVHLNIHASSDSPVFTQAKGVETNIFNGPHPAGNVGVQIHHISPINKGDLIWYVNPQDVIIVGRLFLEGIFDARKSIAIGGPQIQEPHYIDTLIGSSVKPFIENNLKEHLSRIISGSVLTGEAIAADGYVGFYDSQVMAIKEGNYPEFLGWGLPGFGKLSLTRAFWSWLTPNKEFELDTNTHGEERPFVMSNQYDNLFPMDIYPVALLKSIMVNDLDKMEQLGIFEVAPEDFALCEFACTSKINSQQIVREGLDIMLKEG
jgi:Na+-transporting NADH:ubiquinone oxidoreductase subunit A